MIAAMLWAWICDLWGSLRTAVRRASCHHVYTEGRYKGPRLCIKCGRRRK